MYGNQRLGNHSQWEDSDQKVFKKIDESRSNAKRFKINFGILIQTTELAVEKNRMAEKNSMLQKEQYKMPHVEGLTTSSVEVNTSEENIKVWFSSMGVRYAFGQHALCN